MSELHDRRDELAAFQITVMHGSSGDSFRVRIAERGFPIQDYAHGGAHSFKEALRQALHYVSPALAAEVFPDYYGLHRRLVAPKRCKFSALCEHAHPDDIANHPNGDTW